MNLVVYMEITVDTIAELLGSDDALRDGEAAVCIESRWRWAY